MNDKSSSLLADLDAYRRASGLTQLRLAELLGVTQGHLSKVMGGKVSLTRNLKFRIQIVMIGAKPDDDLHRVEREALRLLRTSDTFRALIHAAIKMHNSSERGRVTRAATE